MESYEQKYKAALEWMRFYYPSLEGAAREDAEHYFPELTESEDERIRKGIIEIIKAVSGPDCDVYLDEKKQEECLAYLEKQKEQKPVWKPLEESMEALLLAIEGKWDAIKPTGYMSRRLEDLYDGLVNTFDIGEAYLPKTNYTEKDIEELKTLKSKIDASMEQKPAEWSKEDERIRLACIATINDVIDYERDRWEDYNPGKPYRPITKYDEQIDWLKSLR